jgi:hypothetical protein
MAEALSGAYSEIAVVEDYDGEETETILTQTTDDIEIERDTEDAEWNEHRNKQTQRRELFESADLSFSMIVTDDQENLQDAGLIDDDTGRIRSGTRHEAVYVHVYRDENDDDPAATYEMLDVQFKYENTNLPMDDIGTVEVTGWINGPHGYQQ